MAEQHERISTESLQSLLKVILGVVLGINESQDKVVSLAHRLEELVGRQEQCLVEFDRLLEHGAKIVSLFSQKLLEKNIHEAMKELKERQERSRLVDRKRRERWGKKS